MMDNVQIFGTDQEKHDKNLAEALMRIERVGENREGGSNTKQREV